MTTRRKNERGVALVTVAIFMVVILGFTVLGIDVARHAHTATEVQSIADAAARGGAKALLDNGGDPGTGIARAHAIANLNVMNGTLAPDADVLVDEGHWVSDPVTGDGVFEYCTTNTPCAANGSWGDTTCTPSDDCDRVTAVLAIPHTDVDNLFAGVFDFITGGKIANAAVGTTNQISRVEKLAIAAPSGPGGACQVPEGCSSNDWECYCNNGVAPCIPIAVPDCEFDPPNCNGVDCSLPTLQVASNGSDTAAWTGFDEGANASNIRAYMNQGPCDPPGRNDTIDQQVIGATITLNNGLNAAADRNVFGMAQCIAGLGDAPPQGCEVDENGNILSGERGNVFTLPVVEGGAGCDENFNQDRAMVGFATVRITDVGLDTTPRTVTVEVIRNASQTNAGSGGGCFGTDCRVTMTR
jgi:hypothetical protein